MDYRRGGGVGTCSASRGVREKFCNSPPPAKIFINEAYFFDRFLPFLSNCSSGVASEITEKIRKFKCNGGVILSYK